MRTITKPLVRLNTRVTAKQDKFVKRTAKREKIRVGQVYRNILEEHINRVKLSKKNNK